MALPRIHSATILWLRSRPSADLPVPQVRIGHMSKCARTVELRHIETVYRRQAAWQQTRIRSLRQAVVALREELDILRHAIAVLARSADNEQRSRRLPH